MVTIIIPAARDGPAFLNKKPAWLAQLPQGHLALQQILNDLDCSNVTRIVFVTLQSHVDKYCGGRSETISDLITETVAAKVSKEDVLINRYTRNENSSGNNRTTSATSTPAVSTSGGVRTSGNGCGPEDSTASNHNNLSSSTAAEGALSRVPSVTVVALETSPQSAPETVATAIAEASVSGPIFVKDSDGSFVHKVEEGDYVCGLCISDAIAASARLGGGGHNNAHASSCASSISGGVPLQSTSSAFPLSLPPAPLAADELGSITMASLLSKSFIERTGVLLTNLVEKKLVSDTIAVGGYGFRSAADFVSAAEKAERIKGKITHALTAEASSSTRVFVSNVVQQMLFENVAFSVSLTRSGLSDWKTECGWRSYLNTFRNVIVSLEGELFRPASAASSPNLLVALRDVSSYVPDEGRIDRLVDFKTVLGSRCTIVITSRQPQTRASESVVRRLLEENGVPFDSLVLGVPTAHTLLFGTESSRGW